MCSKFESRIASDCGGVLPGKSVDYDGNQSYLISRGLSSYLQSRRGDSWLSEHSFSAPLDSYPVSETVTDHRVRNISLGACKFHFSELFSARPTILVAVVVPGHAWPGELFRVFRAVFSARRYVFTAAEERG